MTEIFGIVLLIVFLIYLFRSHVLDLIGGWLIPIVRKHWISVTNWFQRTNVKSEKSDIEVQYHQCQQVLSSIKKARYDTETSIEEINSENRKLELAIKTASDSHLSTEDYDKRIERNKTQQHKLLLQCNELVTKEQSLESIMGKLNIGVLLTTSELDNLTREISRSTEYVNNIENQYPKDTL